MTHNIVDSKNINAPSTVKKSWIIYGFNLLVNVVRYTDSLLLFQIQKLEAFLSLQIVFMILRISVLTISIMEHFIPSTALPVSLLLSPLN